MIKKIAAVMVVAGSLAVAGPASAHDRDGGNGGAVVGALIGGAVLGAIVSSAFNAANYDAPAPVAYAPPVPVAPAPVAYGYAAPPVAYQAYPAPVQVAYSAPVYRPVYRQAAYYRPQPYWGDGDRGGYRGYDNRGYDDRGYYQR